MPQVNLPQSDTNPSRGAELESRRAEYVYDFSLDFPVCTKFYRRDIPSEKFNIRALKTLFRLRSNLEAVLENTGYKFIEDLPAMATADLAKNLSTQNLSALSPYYHPDLGPMLPSGRPKDISDYKSLFQKLALPDIANNFPDDRQYAYAFVAGSNPNMLTRMTKPVEKFPISNQDLKKIPEFKDDSLEQMMASGRLYYIDYKDLEILANGQHPQQPKYVYQPIIAFARPRDGAALLPVAIQTSQTPNSSNLVFPGESYDWEIAKGIASAAHYTYHEVLTHLGFTHLVSEAMALSTRRNLHQSHPIYALLSPHFEGTLSVNFAAIHQLIKPGRSVDRLIGSTLTSMYDLLKRERLAFSFKDNYVPTRQEKRGTANKNDLPLYPYRDDAMLVWQAIHQWVGSYVDYFYPNEAALSQDTEIQAWAAEISSDRGGRVKDFASNGGINSKSELIDTLTMIIFTAGPQHAVANFAQRTDMTYLPFCPIAGYSPAPRSKGATMQDWLNFLPPLDVALHQVQNHNLLGGIYHTRLGYYGDEYFNEAPIAAANQNFQKRLSEHEATISEANKTRPSPYIHLLPSNIPQSTNV